LTTSTAIPILLDQSLLRKRSETGFDRLRDLQDLWLLVDESWISVTILEQAAHALRDHKFLAVLQTIAQQNERERTWLLTRIKQAAPQTLVVPM
jgi:hypothetical protein